MLWSPLVYIISSIVIFYIAIEIYLSNRESDVNRIMSVVSFLGGLWSLTQFLRYFLVERLSLIPYLIGYASIAFIPSLFLTLVLSYPVRFRITKSRLFPYLLFIHPIFFTIVIITNPFHKLFFEYYKPLLDYPTAWEGHWNVLGYVFGFSSAIYVFISISIVVYELIYLKNMTKLDRKFLLLILELALILFVPTLIFHVFAVVKIYQPNPFMAIAVAACIIRSYTFLIKYKFLSLEYTREVSMERILEYEMGKSYVVRSRSTAYRLFREFASHCPGLIISVKFPTWIRINFEILTTPIVWLSETEHRYSVNPERIEFEIAYSITEFIRQNPCGVLLIDGISYLYLFNDEKKVYKFVKDVVDMISLSGGTLIAIEEDLNNLDSRRKSLIYSFFEEVIDVDVLFEGESWIYVCSDSYESIIENIKNNYSNLVILDFRKVEVTSMEALTENLLKFIEKHENVVVKDVEFLLNIFDEDSIIKFIKYLQDVCCKHNKKLFIILKESSIAKWIKYFSDEEYKFK